MLDPLFYPYMGGTEKVVYHVGKRLAARGHEIEILTSKIPKTVDREVIDGMSIHRVPSLYFQKLPHPFPPPFSIAPAMSYAVMRSDADVFHIHNRFWYRVLTLAALTSKKGRSRLALTLHNARPVGISVATDTLGGLYDDLIGKQIMRLCNGITAVSGNTRDMTVPADCRRKSTVIYNGIDETVYKPLSPKAKAEAREEIVKKHNIDADFVILTNARLVRQKGLSYLIDAVAELRAKGRDVALVIIGHGPLLGELKAQAERLGIAPNVIFAGAGKFDDELLRYYNAADIFTLPSIWEPCAVALIEAMACGVPTVITRAGGMPEIAAPSVRIVEPRDSRQLASTLGELIDDRKKRTAAAAGTREHVLRNLTWDRIALKYESFYRHLLEGKQLPDKFV